MVYKKNTTNFVYVSLVAICIGLGIVLFTELNIDHSHSRTITAGKIDMTEEITIIDVIEDFPPLTNFQAMIDRPLFMQDRQPYIDEESNEEIKQTRAKKKRAEGFPQQLVLTAIIITPDRHVAIIQTGKNKEPLHLAIGETIDNWTLEEVHSQHIVLKDGEKIEKLELEIQGSPIIKKQRTKKKSTQRIKPQTTETKDNKSADTKKNAKKVPESEAAEI